MELNKELLKDLNDRIVVIGYGQIENIDSGGFSKSYWAGILRTTDYENVVSLLPFELTEKYKADNKDLIGYLQSIETWAVPCLMYFDTRLIFTIADIMERKIRQIG